MRIFILSMFLAISTSISIEGQEEFDSSFLESLPEGVRQDLLDQVTDKKELEDEQYSDFWKNVRFCLFKNQQMMKANYSQTDLASTFLI